MKRFTFALITIGISIVAICGQQPKNLAIDVKQKFTVDGVIGVKDIAGSKVSEEKGRINDIPYTILYSNGRPMSATIDGPKRKGSEELRSLYNGENESWNLRCTTDAMDDVVQCVLNLQDLFITYRGEGDYEFSVGTDNSPDTGIAIRIDQDEPFKFAKPFVRGSDAAKVLKRLESGKQVTTRFTTWPQGHNVDRTFELRGLREGLALMEWAIARY